MKAAVLASEPTQIASNFADLKHCRAPGQLTTPNFSCRYRFLKNANVTHDYPKIISRPALPLAKTSTLAFLMAREYTQDTVHDAVTECCSLFRLRTVLQLISSFTCRPYYRAT